MPGGLTKFKATRLCDSYFERIEGPACFVIDNALPACRYTIVGTDGPTFRSAPTDLAGATRMSLPPPRSSFFLGLINVEQLRLVT